MASDEKPKRKRNSKPAELRRYERLLESLADIPEDDPDAFVQREAIETVRISMHSPEFSPCGRRAIEWLQGKGVLNAKDGKGDIINPTFNFILQMAPAEREKFIAENEQKLLEPTTIDVPAVEVPENKS